MKTFCFQSKHGVYWNVVYWENNDNTCSGYMWHRKPDERITGGWRAARRDAYSKITREAAKVAKEQHGINLIEG